MHENTQYALAGLAVGVLSTFVLKEKVIKIYQLGRLVASTRERMKMVIVLRTDLNMTRGKMAAQAAHAAVGCYKAAGIGAPSELKAWELMGQPKIVVRPDNFGEQELHTLSQKATNLGIVNTLIRDAGRTQLESGTVTCLAIGPASSSLVDKVSGHLKLL